MTNIFEGKYSRPFTFAKAICTETFKHCKFRNTIMAPPLQYEKQYSQSCPVPEFLFD